MTAALITGASTGMGRELASLFAAERRRNRGIERAQRRGAHCIGRGIAVTPRCAGGRHHYGPVKAGAGAELVARVDELGVDVEYLVNNAGVGILGLKAQDSDPAAVSRMVQLNVVTTTDLTMLYVARMVKRVAERSSTSARSPPTSSRTAWRRRTPPARPSSGTSRSRWRTTCAARESPAPTWRRAPSAPSSPQPRV